MTNPTESLVARLRAFDEERFYQEPATAYATMQEAAERLSTLEAALRNIAEGNLGNDPWQANYEKIREVARTAISNEPGK